MRRFWQNMVCRYNGITSLPSEGAQYLKHCRRIALFALMFFLTTGLLPHLQGGAGSCSYADTNTSQSASTKAEALARKPAKVKSIRTTVLFFNDLHGNLMPFKVKKDDGSSAEVGGIAGIATLVREIREENNKKGIKTFLLVAGDVLQGTPMSTVFQGKPDIEIFNILGVSAMTVGNHEFDFGLENFLNMKKAASFPIISSNIIWRDSRQLMNTASVAFPLGHNTCSHGYRRHYD